jgi:hypothetical protein
LQTNKYDGRLKNMFEEEPDDDEEDWAIDDDPDNPENEP